MPNMLTPLTKNELLQIFDKIALNVLELCMKKLLISQPERLVGQHPLPIQVPKEHIEQWVVQAIGATPVGAGAYPIDVIKPGEFGADIKMLSCKVNSYGELSDTTSGETSLAQKFTSAGVDLDTAFAQKNYDAITNDWIEILKAKLNRVTREQCVDKLYYIFILRASTKFHLCAAHININNIDMIATNKDKTTSTSIFLNNVIDDHFGNAKIYKSKKRLELRLKPKYWVDNNHVITFDFSEFIPPMVNLRNLIQQKDNNIAECLQYLIGRYIQNE
ncbi:hypothetical protein [Intestinibacter bartlettii]|uniref:Uncharacterized protein n=1 Tax=Intestinibacter bartlettii TaxID=261299 RepID=A0ABS8CYA8_9FIRM|nr:hypothetical protein [Intestinibacter bartlettii]MCB5397652.1 hypothetical protein [Intestinibacter bartlettii]MCB5404962.1 hypothetical protein [Intestinibacter bartlettii]MCB5446464.1 hypothetical protein [Intestinibacter bartlettii]MCB5749191.1 hypothetical protein [Intestinibacter bartlettii]